VQLRRLLGDVPVSGRHAAEPEKNDPLGQALGAVWLVGALLAGLGLVHEVRYDPAADSSGVPVSTPDIAPPP
jgi:hypothetical protein